MPQFFRSYWLLYLLFGSIGLHAQSTPNKVTHGMELWQGVRVKKFFTSAFYLGFNNQARFNDQVRKFKFAFFDLQTGYKLHELCSIAMGYRYTLRLVSTDHRGYFDLLVHKRFTKIRTAVNFRLKFQVEKANITQSTVGYKVRPRLSFKYYPNNWARWNFKLYMEWFYAINDNEKAFTHYRIALGARYRINDQLYFNMTYLFQHKFASTFPSMAHVAYLTLYIKLAPASPITNN